jgi:hypothetical protein|tara:strand:+ start:3892 stop:4152 length:261 start_codon:yes stop_codon:yes gene_type:complete
MKSQKVTKKYEGALDWKDWSVAGWPYDGDVDDPRYIEERALFFISNAPSHAPFNGWWIASPNRVERRRSRGNYTQRRKDRCGYNKT